LAKSGFKIAQLQYRDGIGLCRQLRQLFKHDVGAFTYRTANVVDMLMVQDGEEPSPQIGAVLPEMLLGDRPGQAVLDEIVSAIVPQGVV
jgi:hypothetical protein